MNRFGMTGPDLAAATLLGNRPKILKAFKIVPSGPQPGMKSVAIGSRRFNPTADDFFVAVIEERQKLDYSHPHYLLLKIIANSLYGIFAELNKYEFGKNNAKQLVVFSGEHKFKQKTFILEKPGRWQFAPAAALITAGGRLMLAILERMVANKGGTYLLTDTDSMLIVAGRERRKGTLCLSGQQARGKSAHMDGYKGILFEAESPQSIR